MPIRIVPLITNQFYHLFNRGINKQSIFLESRDYSRAVQAFEFYSFAEPVSRFSKFLQLPKENREKLWQEMRKGKRLVEIISYCLMPNHFHFLLKQIQNGGISKFLRLFEDSYTRYFNTKYEKFGPILQGQFKAVRIEDDNQLLHLSRYHHLNPYTSYLVKDFVSCENYLWSSFPEYLGKTKISICQKEIIMANFKDPTDYQKFVLDQADYQRELDGIKHFLLEET